MAVAAQTRTDYAPPIGPNTIRATNKWSGGNGADLFARRGEPIYAFADGFVQPYHGVQSPFGEVPSFLLRGTSGVTGQYTHVVLTAQGQVHKGDRIGYVGDNGLQALGSYPGMPDDFQHLDFVLGNGSGPFPVTGGNINVNQWLNSIGYTGRVFQGQTRGPNGAGGGGSSINPLQTLSGIFGQQYGGLGQGQLTEENPIGGQFAGGGQSVYGTGEPGDAGGLSPGYGGGDALSGLTGLFESAANTQFQVSKRIDFQNPFEGIPEEWADMIPFLVAAMVVTVGVGLIEHGEEHGGTRSPAIWLAIIIVLGVMLYRQAKGGGTVADAIVDAINTFTPSLQNIINMPQQQSPANGTGTSAQPVLANRPGLPSIVNGAQNLASRALGIAVGQRGKPYVWAGASPASSFDCSGLVQWAYAQAGVNLPRTADQQYRATQRISQAEARPGDLVFFGSGTITHVGIYAGNGRMFDALDEGTTLDYHPITAVRNLAGFGRVR